jgi:hypothetical protein
MQVENILSMTNNLWNYSKKEDKQSKQVQFQKKNKKFQEENNQLILLIKSKKKLTIM